MKLFSNYTNVINKALSNQTINESKDLHKGLGSVEYFAPYTIEDYSKDKKELKISQDLTSVATQMGAVYIDNQEVGKHPDFAHLKYSGLTEKHYIISAFIDIKNSTNLYKRYDEETIYIITNTVQKLAINIVSIFGGFIQRIQGDGLFVYFGRKGLLEEKATEHALMALSIFSYYINNNLKKMFIENNIENIYTTIGVDLGKKSKVLWGLAGQDNVSEIGTFSLHSSLASKMQGYAKSNEMVVGDNIKDVVNYENDLFTVVENKRYIFEIPEKQFRYTQYVFNWLRHIKTAGYLAISSNSLELEVKPQKIGRLPIIEADALREVAKDNKPYLQNPQSEN